MSRPTRRNTGPAALAWTLAGLLAGLAVPESGFAASGNPPASAPSVPVVFEENRGQAGPHVIFLARGAAYNVSIEATATALFDRRSGQIVRIRLLDSRPDVEIAGLEPLPGRIHYIHGPNPARWNTDVPTYARIAYREAYPGIDAIYKPAAGGLFEQEFLLRPGADPAAIRLAFEGARRLVVDKTGDLVLATEKAPVRLGRPIGHQDIDGVRRTISVAWRIRGSGEAGFRLGRYDRSRPLVIDPVITWATYVGNNDGHGQKSAFGVAVDSQGNSYVTGDAMTDVFVTKLNPTGQQLIYSVFISGSGAQGGRAISLDRDSNAYVAGFTTSVDFPITPGALQTRHGGGSFDFPLDAFVLKLGPTGIPVYSTYLGGRDDDVALGIGVDAVGRVYVTGGTRSTDFPVANALQPQLAGVIGDQCEPRHQIEICDEDGCRLGTVEGTCPRDAFVARLSAQGIIEYSTFLGGNADDVANAIAIDDGGNAYVIGSSQGTFPVTSGSLQTHLGGPDGGLDAFVARIDANAALGWATYLGGTETDTGTGIAVDSSGRPVVVGHTSSPDFPSTDGDRFPLGGGYVVKLDANGTAIIWSRSTGFALPAGVALDSQGRAHLVGTVGECGRRTVFPPQCLEFNQNVSVETRAATGERLSFFSFGGSAHSCCGADDFGEAIAVSGNSVWVVGSARSDDFPTTPGTVRPTAPFPSMWAFVARLDEPTDPVNSDGSSSERCLIATAAFGSAHVWEVATFRRFRDRALLPHAPGRLFVRTYYRLSPPLARAVASHPPLAAVVRALLTPMAIGADFVMDRPETATVLVGLALAVIVGLGVKHARRI